MKTKEQIIKWLEEQQLQNEFYENCFKHKTKDVIYNEDCILTAFSWDKTEQGYEYWARINKEYCNWYYGTWVSCPPDEVDRVDERNDMKRYPDFIPENWTDCYELPLHIGKYGSYAYDSHGTMALSSFNYRYNDDGDYAEGEIERVEKIISIINGEIESDYEPAWSIDEHEPARINYKGEYQFLVRGWGHLTGCGNAMNLPVEIAEKMQDGFIAYLVDRLNISGKR